MLLKSHLRAQSLKVEDNQAKLPIGGRSWAGPWWIGHTKEKYKENKNANLDCVCVYMCDLEQLTFP